MASKFPSNPIPLDPTTSTYPQTLGLAPGRSRLAGRHILVVGAGQRKIIDEEPPIGNGRAMSVLFAREGAKVVCLDSDADAGANTVEQIRAEGGQAWPLVLDVRDAAGIGIAVAEARRLMGGKLDGVVLNAAYTKGLPLKRITADSWDEEFAVNVRAHVLFLKETIGLDGLDDGGSVVLISSMAGQRASGAGVAYESSKAALGGLIRAGARNGEPRGIRCNGIAMGYVDTPMGRDASRHTKGRAYRVPFGRQATGWETAHTALFLMSHDSSYVSGTILNMDGGFSAGSDGRVRKTGDNQSNAPAVKAKV